MQQERNWISKEAVYAVGGLAAGVLISRLAPPLFGIVSGRMRTGMGADPFELLIDDHRRIQAALREMEQHADGSIAQRGKLFLVLKRTLGKHAMAEEDVVYPMLTDAARRDEYARRLYQEHAEMKIKLFELEELLKRRESWHGKIQPLRELIEGHIRDEENREFPALRQTLLESGRRKLAGQIRREEAMVL